MNDPRYAPSVVYPGAVRRAGMLVVLLASFGWYARGSSPVAPAPEAAAPAAGRHVVVRTAGPDAPDPLRG
ncbi:MAG: hypothetical protein SF051_11790, partial [Elusimicrobiota bacterium]|nr:hypothetical protein [Elusimicrobiota bacterium]